MQSFIIWRNKKTFINISFWFPRSFDLITESVIWEREEYCFINWLSRKEKFAFKNQQMDLSASRCICSSLLSRVPWLLCFVRPFEKRGRGCLCSFPVWAEKRGMKELLTGKFIHSKSRYDGSQEWSSCWWRWLLCSREREKERLEETEGNWEEKRRRKEKTCCTTFLLSLLLPCSFHFSFFLLKVPSLFIL